MILIQSLMQFPVLQKLNHHSTPFTNLIDCIKNIIVIWLKSGFCKVFVPITVFDSVTGIFNFNLVVKLQIHPHM